MTIHHTPDARHAVPATKTPWSVRRRMPAPVMPQSATRCHVSWLTRRGEIDDAVRMVPDTRLFRETFSAVVRGAILATTAGPVAIEDLLPGDEVVTADGPRELLWKGSQTFMRSGRARSLYRIPADALGLGRPMPDLLLGPGARLVTRRAALSAITGNDHALVPVADLVDGMSVIEIAPISAVQTFHLGFEGHCTFAVNGVEIDSVHPGRLDPALGEEFTSLYLDLFPHISRAEDFGALALPRLVDAMAREVDAA